MYYAFVSGLPKLSFEPEKKWENPDDFLNRLTSVLTGDELKWALLLWFRKYHSGIAFYLSGKINPAKLPSGFPAEIFDPSNESFAQLPEYLQNLVHWTKSTDVSLNEIIIGQKLQELYFKQLLGSDNQFIKSWAEFELNLVNYLAAGRGKKMSEDKQSQLIEGNEYYKLLMDFSDNSKLIQSEFSSAVILDQVLTNNNLLEAELEIDKLRWATIDNINRFEYFSADVIIGYFQKLLMLERWNKIIQPVKISEPDEIAETLLGAYSGKN